MKRIKKVISITLSFVMLLCFLPSSVLAQIGEALSSEENEASTDVTVSEDLSLYVLGEVEDRRTENTKTFRMSDGSYIVADYGKKIHFEDENGTLQDYDNTLAVSEVMTLDADDFAGAVNADSDISIKLANNSNSNNLLKIQKDEYKISLHLVDADKSKAIEIHTPEAEPTGNDIDSATTLHKFSSGAIYRDILPSVDLEYIISGGTVKENIIVKEQLDSYTFTFELKLNGLNPVLQSDGSIALNSATSAEPVMVIPKGVMYDANGESSNAVEYAITHKNGNKYTLTVTASAEWINAEDRAFPVTVDPTFTPADNGANTEDIQISDSGTAYSYTASTITVGRNGSYQNQMLIKAKTLPELPDSAVIVDAQLRLKKSSVTLGATIAAHIVTSEWSSSTVTWADKPNSSTTVIDYHTINAASAAADYYFDITKAAQYWYDNDKNTGVLLAPLSSGGTGSVTFYSSDASSSDNKPVITVSYRDMKGIESRWSFATQSAGNSGTGYVNGFNGNLVFAHADMATEGSVIPITVSHIYNSFQADLEFTSGDSINAPKTADYGNMKVGKGWKLSVQQTVIKEIIDSKTYYVYNDSDGTERYFKEVNGIYVDEDGNGLTLTINGSGEETEYVIENETGVEYIFDYTGKINYIVDVHGNKKRFTYNDNGALYAIYYEPVEVDLQQQLVFAYNAEGALKQITNGYNNNDYVQFLYSETISGTPSVDDSGYLREIKYYNGTTLLNTVYYEYYSYAGIESYGKTGALKSAKDGDTGYMLEYRYDTYEGRFRVALAKESVNGTDGQNVGFEYEDKLFTVRTSGSDDVYGNSDDLYTHTLFNDYGSAICSYSQFDGAYDVLGASYAEYMPYEAAAETNYKIKTSAVKGITNNNLLYNPNCEPSSAWTKMADGDGYSASYTTEEKYFGTGSLKLTSTDGGTGFAMYSDSVYLTAGTYTLSAYVKLVGVASENYGFYLRCINSGDYKTGTTNTAIDNGWQRISHTFTVTSAGNYDVVFSLQSATGTAYIDCAQLEKGESPSDFNFIENGGFDSARKWSGTYTLTNGRATLNGSPTAQNRITQTIALNSPINSTFMLSGWAEASSVSLTTSENRKFGVIAKLTYSDNSTDEFELSFNPENPNRQYASTAIVPKKTDTALTVTSIEISVAYDYNANTAYFDDVALTIEPAQTYAYDEEGEMVAATDILGNENAMEYNPNGVDLDKYTSITGEIFEYDYNSAHQVTKTTKTSGTNVQYAEYAYDLYGNINNIVFSSESSNYIRTLTYEYDDYGNYMSKSIDELGNATVYDYDSVTKLLNYIEDANSNRMACVYDNHDRITAKYLDADKDGVVDASESRVEYLRANNRLSDIVTNTTQYNLTYDVFGNIQSIKAGSYVLTTYEYASNNGKLKKVVYGNGDYEEYAYDDLERLVEVKYNGTIKYSLKYDTNGNLHSMTEDGSTKIYEYDSLERLIRARQEDANGNELVAVENTYDALGRPKGATYVVGNKTMTYSLTYKGNSDLVSTISMPASAFMSNINYSYDEFERLATKNLSLSTAREYYEDYEYYTYTDTEGKQHTSSLVSSVTHRVTYGGNTTSTVYSYTYDDLGNIKTVKKDGVQISSYSYDALGQLTTEIDYVNSRVYSYAYDKSGNITSKTIYNQSNAAVVDRIAYTYSSSAWGDLLTGYDGTTINYDASGNPLNWRNSTALSWDIRELSSQSLSNGDSVTYEYNHDGKRTRKQFYDSVAAAYRTYDYVLDDSKILYENVTDNTNGINYKLHYLYDANGIVVGFIYNNATYYYQKNLQSDIVRILNSTGTAVVEYTYDAWGNILTITGSMASTLGNYNAFRYRGYYYDRETGFYYLNSRYYDPTVGRFLNADTLEYLGNSDSVLSYNLYAYCGNNPVRFADYEGEWLHIIAGAVVGAVTSVVSDFVEIATTGSEMTAWEIVGNAIVGASCGAVAAAGAPMIAATMQSCYDATKTVCEAYELNHDDNAENDVSVGDIVTDIVIDTTLNFAFSAVPCDAGDDVAKKLTAQYVAVKEAKEVAKQTGKKAAKNKAKKLAVKFVKNYSSTKFVELATTQVVDIGQFLISECIERHIEIYYQ